MKREPEQNLVTFLEPGSPQATDATRGEMVTAFAAMLGGRLGYAALDTRPWERFTQGEYEELHEWIDRIASRDGLRAGPAKVKREPEHRSSQIGSRAKVLDVEISRQTGVQYAWTIVSCDKDGVAATTTGTGSRWALVSLLRAALEEIEQNLYEDKEQHVD